MSAEHNNQIEADLMDNIQMCLDTGYGMLISGKNNADYRNAVVLIHNGLELIMKLFLLTKNKYLVYEQLDQYLILKDIINDVRGDKTDHIQRKVKHNTISFSKCYELLDYFLDISIPDIEKLNKMRNNCVHFQFTIYKSDIRKLLISKIYPLIKLISNSLNQDISKFINQYATLDTWCSKINDEIYSKYIQVIAAAKKHYFEELNDKEREDKNKYEDYTVNGSSKLVFCPACKNNALLEIKIIYITDEDGGIRRTTKSKILKNLTCHYCGLIVNDRDQLLINFYNNENSVTSSIETDYFYDCPDDCAPEDCPDEYDCPDDCAPEDCPDEYDCPDDCAPEDCPDEYDCPDDCAPEDCPDN